MTESENNAFLPLSTLNTPREIMSSITGITCQFRIKKKHSAVFPWIKTNDVNSITHHELCEGSWERREGRSTGADRQAECMLLDYYGMSVHILNVIM
jgi:hypothetical protein